MLGMRGDLYIARRMQAHFTIAGWAEEQISGVSSLFYLRRLVDEIDRDWKTVLARLETLRKLLITRRGLICNVTVDAESWEAFTPGLEGLLDSLPDNAANPSPWELKLPDRREGFAIPAQVNYVGQCINLFKSGYTLDGSLEVIIQFLRMTYLWEKIRAQGGAYGAFCDIDSNAGLVTADLFQGSQSGRHPGSLCKAWLNS